MWVEPLLTLKQVLARLPWHEKKAFSLKCIKHINDIDLNLQRHKKIENERKAISIEQLKVVEIKVPLSNPKSLSYMPQLGFYPVQW